MAYHLNEIPKGELGEISKIIEEIEELRDAEEQGCKIMALVELSDVYGAIEFYLNKHYPGIIMEDLKEMHEITKRAFESGRR